MDSITLISILSLSFTFIIVLIKLCFKSKCDKVECLCIKIHRNTIQENEQEKYNIEHNIIDNDLEVIKQSIK
jgi:hypothetical protein